MEIVTTKEKLALVVDGYLFYKDYKHNDKIYWRCSEHTNSCKARVHTTNGQVVFTNDHKHNHSAKASDIASREVMSKIKTQALSNTESPQSIVSKAYSAVPLGIGPSLPKVSSAKRTIRRQRQTKEDYPQTPKTRNDFDIPEKFKMSSRDEPFLIYDSGKVEDRMLIFGTKMFINLMKVNQNWYADGTFKKCPSIFAQVYTVHIILQNESMPIIFALLPNKKRETYVKFFQKVKEEVQGVDPLSIMLDFELATIQAIEEVFPGTLIRLCFFHLTQSLYRWLSEHGHKVKYDTDVVFANKCKQLCALAYVPVDQVQTYFDKLSESFEGTPDQEILDEILTYFARTYISYKDIRQNVKEGRYKIDYWNFLGALELNLPRTNNHQEGWHRRFNGYIEENSPNLWKVLETFKIEEGKNETVTEQIDAGADTGTAPKKKMLKLWDRINLVVSNYDSMEPLNFLSAIASNIS